MITDYLLKLLDELNVPRRRRRRILAEVGDHLACAAADLHADGLTAEEAEREAVRRFGPAAELACSFVEQEAAFGGKRTAQASGLLAVMFAFLAHHILPDGTFPGALVAFVLAQVALVAGTLTVLRAWRAAPLGGLRGVRLALVLHGSIVVVGCAAGTITVGMIGALSGAASGALATNWPSFAGLVVCAGAALAVLSRSWRLAVNAATPGIPHRRGPGGIGEGEPPALAAAGSAPDALDDLQAAAVLALARLQRRLPALRGLLGRVASLAERLPVKLSRGLPRLAAWLDLRAHPWRFAVSVAGAAGIGLASVHGVTEGLPTMHHLLLGLIGAGLIASIEAIAALLGFALLGRFLGIRPPRSQD